MTVAFGDRSAKGKFGHVRIFPIDEVYPSPENDRLYRPVNLDDPDILSLADSIRAHGVQEPLILTRDHYIVSGHRRHASASLAGLKEIPCRVRKDVSREEDPDEFLQLLRECNRQRVKSLDEQLREEVVSASPEEAYESLIEHREQQSAIDVETLDIGHYKRRATITKAKGPMLAAIQRVIVERKEFWPLSDRQIHYALLNDPPLIHASKPDSSYRNDLSSYKALVDLLTRGRLAGEIPFIAIADETRPVTVWTVHNNAQAFIADEMRDLLKNYWRDLLQSQPNHIELLIEKNTVLPILKPVAMRFCLPVTSGRGYCSLPPRRDIAQRYKKSGKEKLVLLIASDFDPDGQTIATSFARSMRDDFHILEVEAVKVALTGDQVKNYHLPPLMTAKAGCSTRAKFVEEHGEHVYELEALNPKDLQEITEAAIDSVLDIDAFNHELDREKEEAALLDTSRRRMFKAMEGVG